jgi:hypothetical protein
VWNDSFRSMLTLLDGVPVQVEARQPNLIGRPKSISRNHPTGGSSGFLPRCI